MRNHLRKPGIWIAIGLLFAAWLLWSQPAFSPQALTSVLTTSNGSHEPLKRTSGNTGGSPAPESNHDARTTDISHESGDSSRAVGDPDVALPAFLPVEARDTIVLILQGGPYPYRQDDSTFGNREGHLPHRPHGYYHEYTVDTPDLDHRGARRIVTGGDPPEAWYYTDDHYDSFRAFDVANETRQ